MDTEKRLLLTLGSILGILTLWSLLSPPIEPDPVQPPGKSSEASIVSKPSPPESSKIYKTGFFDLGMGEKHGGIQSLRVDDETLLEGSSPGFLQIEQIDPILGPVPLRTRPMGSVIISESLADTEGIVVRREIFPESGRSNFLFGCRISTKNSSERPQKIQLRVVGYRPLHIDHPHHAQFLYGSAMVEGKPEKLAARQGHPKRFGQMPEWISSQGKSHAMILSPGQPGGMFHVEQLAGGETVGWLELPRVILAPGEEISWPFRVYAGPLAMSALRQAGVEGAISFGVFSGVTKLLLRFLSWSYGWLHNYGLAICFLSLAVWLPFAPVTFWGMKMSSQTMQKMAELKPQEERIRKENKGNPQKTQKELMELYRRHNVNPASGCIGCLPFLFTWPVYIGLFQVLNRAPELRGAQFFWIRDLSQPDMLIRFPTEIPLLGAGLNILPVLATAVTFLQQNAMQISTSVMSAEQKAQQQMMKFFPLMMLVFFYGLPSGFMLYWVVNSALMAGQQLLAKRMVRS